VWARGRTPPEEMRREGARARRRAAAGGGPPAPARRRPRPVGCRSEGGPRSSQAKPWRPNKPIGHGAGGPGPAQGPARPRPTKASDRSARRRPLSLLSLSPHRQHTSSSCRPSCPSRCACSCRRPCWLVVVLAACESGVWREGRECVCAWGGGEREQPAAAAAGHRRPDLTQSPSPRADSLQAGACPAQFHTGQGPGMSLANHPRIGEGWRARARGRRAGGGGRGERECEKKAGLFLSPLPARARPRPQGVFRVARATGGRRRCCRAAGRSCAA
jgi:hypothetical protein